MPVPFYTVNSKVSAYQNLVEDEMIDIDSLVTRFLVMSDCVLGIMHQSLDENKGISQNNHLVIRELMPTIIEVIQSQVLRHQLDAKTKSDVLEAIKKGKLTIDDAMKLMEAFDLAEKSPEEGGELASKVALNISLSDTPQITRSEKEEDGNT